MCCPSTQIPDLCLPQVDEDSCLWSAMVSGLCGHNTCTLAVTDNVSGDSLQQRKKPNFGTKCSLLGICNNFLRNNLSNFSNRLGAKCLGYVTRQVKPKRGTQEPLNNPGTSHIAAYLHSGHRLSGISDEGLGLGSGGRPRIPSGPKPAASHRLTQAGCRA